MNTHYTKDDVVELASVIFTNDINSDVVAKTGLPTEEIAKASFYAAEVFFNTAADYHNGKLDKMLSITHGSNELKQESPERRESERRSTPNTSPEEDEAFVRLEQALKDQFLNATLNAIFRGK